MRYIIYGAGAIGGIIGGRLFQQGRDVVLIARGDHCAALRERGLTLQSPRGSASLAVPTVNHPSGVEFRPDDVVILAMKTQDTAPALAHLLAATGLDVPLFCAQNGVENERLAARHFERVYGVMVFMPGTYLQPGVVQSHGSPVDGILHIGRYPHGIDELSRSVAADLVRSNISAPVVGDIMRWKYAKLLGNLGNALQAVCGLDADVADLYRSIYDEAMACFGAAGIEWASREEMRESRGDFTTEAAEGKARSGGSSWQSLERGAGSIEADYLNGEIVLLGALHGVPTPVNRLIQQMANGLARERMPPGSVLPEQIRQRLAAAVE